MERRCRSGSRARKHTNEGRADLAVETGLAFLGRGGDVGHLGELADDAERAKDGVAEKVADHAGAVALSKAPGRRAVAERLESVRQIPRVPRVAGEDEQVARGFRAGEALDLRATQLLGPRGRHDQLHHTVYEVDGGQEHRQRVVHVVDHQEVHADGHEEREQAALDDHLDGHYEILRQPPQGVEHRARAGLDDVVQDTRRHVRQGSEAGDGQGQHVREHATHHVQVKHRGLEGPGKLRQSTSGVQAQKNLALVDESRLVLLEQLFVGAVASTEALRLGRFHAVDALERVVRRGEHPLVALAHEDHGEGFDDEHHRRLHHVVHARVPPRDDHRVDQVHHRVRDHHRGIPDHLSRFDQRGGSVVRNLGVFLSPDEQRVQHEENENQRDQNERGVGKQSEAVERLRRGRDEA